MSTSGLPFNIGAFPSSGSNQYMDFPLMSQPTSDLAGTSPRWANTQNPGTVPAANGPYSSGNVFPTLYPSTSTSSGVGQATKLPGGHMTSPTLDPGFTQAFDDWLKGQIGKGATPYDLQAVLPSTGQTTGAGQLTAGMNPELQQLMQFFTTGQPGTMPGASTLGDMSKTGMPIDVMPEWQAMIDAQQRNIGQGSANLREQFASLGNLKSSPFGGAMSDYYSQTAKDQNALLGQLEAGSLESARGRQMDSSSLLTQLGGQMGQYIQGLDQSSIDRLLQEFVRTRPENSPLLGAQFGMATTFPPTYEKKGGIGQAIVGSLGDILGGLGGIFGL